eukprot:UN01426
MMFALIVLFVTTTVSAKNQTVYHTSYGWDDNSPPSAEIAYPKSDGYPTKHNQAYEGTGTYADPITFATDKDEIAIGSIVWVSDLHKYFVMEDDCAACDSDWRNGKWHIDLWMGPDKRLPESKLYACEDYITKSGVTVIINPAQNLPVDKTPLINPSTGDCTAVIYRN